MAARKPLPAAASQHAALVRQVHAARTRLGLDDATYRAALAAQADGKSSSLDCSVAELRALMEHFHRCGFPRPGQAPGKPARKPLTQQQKKMWALWQTLADAGRVRDRSMRGLLKWIEGQTANQVQALDWLTPAQENTIIESLKQWRDRHA